MKAKPWACKGQFNYSSLLSNREWTNQAGLLWDGSADYCLLSTWSNLLRHTAIDWLLHANRRKPFQMHFCTLPSGRCLIISCRRAGINNRRHARAHEHETASTHASVHTVQGNRCKPRQPNWLGLQVHGSISKINGLHCESGEGNTDLCI